MGNVDCLSSKVLTAVNKRETQSLLQQVLAQSAELRQAPPMNWPPAPLPTFCSPAGSGVRPWGSATTVRATVCVAHWLVGERILHWRREAGVRGVLLALV